MAADTPVIPQTITVHLGRPNAAARNVTVPFTDYLKNVASSEIYPTWPDNAIRANIYAQASFALNRIYTEHYRSRGYDFDITNSTAYDQAYIEGRSVFSNVAKIVDELFNNYVTKGDQVQPYFTQYCSGREVTCDGLSQWGTVTLANQGYTPYRILQYYYGNDVNIKTAPVKNIRESYPGRALRLGDISEDVRIIQRQLNRIAQDYPAFGTVTVDGRELSTLKDEELTIFRRRKIGFVFQNYNLFRNKTALQNVTEGLIVARKLPKEQAEEIGMKMLAKVGLADRADYYPRQLSGGQQQRVAIARALAADPEIIYFDEPTSALDPELTGEVLSVMRQLAEEGMTMLVVTHEMGFARNVSSKTVFMENGVVVEQAPSQQFFASPKEERTRAFLRRIAHTE